MCFWKAKNQQKQERNTTSWKNMYIYIYLSRSSMCQKLNSGFRMIILVHWPIGSWVSSFCEAQTFSRPWRPWEVHRQSPRLPKPAAVSLVSMQTLSTGLFIPFRLKNIIWDTTLTFPGIQKFLEVGSQPGSKRRLMRHEKCKQADWKDKIYSNRIDHTWDI